MNDLLVMCPHCMRDVSTADFDVLRGLCLGCWLESVNPDLKKSEDSGLVPREAVIAPVWLALGATATLLTLFKLDFFHF